MFRGIQEKKLMFHFQDHATDEIIANQLMEAAAKAKFRFENDAQIELAIKRFKLERLKMVAELQEMSNYQSVDNISFPDKTSILEWLIQIQNNALSSDKPVLADFHRPILLEMLLLPDAIL